MIADVFTVLLYNNKVSTAIVHIDPLFLRGGEIFRVCTRFESTNGLSVIRSPQGNRGAGLR